MYDCKYLRSKKRTTGLAGLLLIVCTLAQAQVHLVKDYNSDPKNGNAEWLGTSDDIVEANRITYFVSHTNLNGAELWRTDGTEAGTSLVKDIFPGPGSSFPQELTNVNGTLFFSAYNREHGRELWKTDGTVGGTALVKDLASGQYNDSGDPTGLFNANGTLYFRAVNSFGHSMGLMKTDGTAENTVVVAPVSFPHNFAYADGITYFSAEPAVGNEELWRTDGTREGTWVVKEINPGDASSRPSDLTVINDIVYFMADNGEHGRELWKTAGTEETTVMVKDINPGPAGSGAQGQPSYFTSYNNMLFFVVRTNDLGWELWKSDGTEANTKLVRDIRTGTNKDSSPNSLAVSNNTLYFIAFHESYGWELWKTDGSEGGTVLAAEVHEGVDNGFDLIPTRLADVNGALYFRAGAQPDVWKSDGTQAGTGKLNEINTGGSYPYGLKSINGRLYFYASDDLHGHELWKSDGTPASTNMVKDVGIGSHGGSVRQLFTFRGAQYFSAPHDGYGDELTVSNGTEAGTRIVKDMTPGEGGSVVNQYLDIGEIMLMNVSDNAESYRIWKSDGTEAGTVPVSTAFSYIDEFAYVNGVVYFVPGTGDQLWKSDLATGNTEMIKDFMPSGNYHSIYGLTSVNGILFFAASTNDGSGYELWKCDDSTTNGTVLVRNINTAAGEGSSPSELIAVNNTLFFTATDADGERELWKSDGTLAGTVIVKDINNNGSTSPLSLSKLNGMLYFQANYDVEGHGTELWKSDGTEDGTVLVKAISETIVQEISGSTQVNNTLYFWADDGEHGLELWKTDGTEGGTTLVKDVTPGPAATSYEDMTAVGDKLFFILDGELWKSEGDACSTLPVTDINQISVWDISDASAGGKLFFIGTNATSGDELFYYDLAHVVQGACGQTITFNSLDPRTYGDAAFEVTAVSSSNLDVTLESSNPAVAKVDGKKITIIAAGETVITASQAGDNRYKAAQPVTQTLTVNKKAQSITFAALPAKTFGDAQFNPGARASSNLSVSYSSSNTNVATVDDNMVIIVGPGTTVITASQGGDLNHAPAANVEQILTVSKRAQRITFAAIPEKFLGDDSFNLEATASSALPVTYTSSNAAVATIHGNVVTLAGEGETIITATQEGNAEYAPAPAQTQKLVVKLITEAETTPDRVASVYPNPVTDYVTIETQEAVKGTTVRLTDSYGRVMNTPSRALDDFTHTLNVSNLPAGMYLVQVSSGNRVIATKRIVKK